MVRDRTDVSQITIDATRQLVEPAGALCTRIIGVRLQQLLQSDQPSPPPIVDTSSLQAMTNSDDDATSNPLFALPKSHVRRHLYIDDGCYGSLCSNNGDDNKNCGDGSGGGSSSPLHCPLPLFSHTGRDADEARTTELFRTTLWGPTCDGLDRVCHDILLPALRRDEWLVFPNATGQKKNSEGLGTAFNGFAPPDTCYCVLGYFAN